jgi:hypothetical protein
MLGVNYILNIFIGRRIANANTPKPESHHQQQNA